eukprot:1130802-Alexandrium_andersonii.AAC.1
MALQTLQGAQSTAWKRPAGADSSNTGEDGVWTKQLQNTSATIAYCPQADLASGSMSPLSESKSNPDMMNSVAVT